MKKKIGLLLATVMVLNTVSTVVYGFTNPLKSYNLYEDTRPSNPEVDNSSRETVMDEFYSNSLYNKDGNNNSDNQASSSSNNYDPYSQNSENIKPVRRNDHLRESSRKVYGNPEVKAGWLEAESFYPEPTLENIMEQFKKENYSGCLQESISYVRLNPNDTIGFYYLAMCYSKISDKENAIKAYEQVIALNENPMIVKYATNGRNCVLGNETEKCYPNVDEPELLYPYANKIPAEKLKPVDPNVLVKRNLKRLQEKLSPSAIDGGQGNVNLEDGKEQKIILPFGQQDDKLDKFINAPYGNGLSPSLNKEYKQIQLRKIQESINIDEENPNEDVFDVQYIKKFDKQKSESESLKLAYVAPSDKMSEFYKDPEYIQTQKELNELRMLLGSENSKSTEGDLMDLVPKMSEQDKNLSPDMIEAMMVKTMMPDFSFVDSKDLL